ncbi:MAG: CDP-alcohol phosphatidyltransferase family protein [Dehalococcoidia bacterium]|nr:CDP-alcohol phosphatidyltransferase family protein [Dehalococcoidia bacterium]
MKTLRPLAATLTLPIAKVIAKTPLTPNALTMIGLALSVGVAVFIPLVDARVGGVLLLVAAAFDLLDGAVARLTGTTSAFGAFLDSTIDRVSEAVVLVGVGALLTLHGDQVGQMVAFAALTGSLLVSYVRARAEGLGLHGEVGVMDRPARVLTLAAGLIVGAPVVALGVITVFTAITVAQRVLYVRQQLRDSSQ